jgi:hypothetical protein
MIIDITLVVVGLLLAFAGRRLFWLLVATAGFLVGYTLVGFLLPGVNDWIPLVTGLVLGLVFAFLAKGFTKFLLGLAGFILVGSLALTLAGQLGFTGNIPGLVVFLLGGLVGIGLVLFAFDLSLVLLSVLAGAALFVRGLPGIIPLENQTLVLISGIVLAVVGFLAQWRGRR